MVAEEVGENDDGHGEDDPWRARDKSRAGRALPIDWKTVVKTRVKPARVEEITSQRTMMAPSLTIVGSFMNQVIMIGAKKNMIAVMTRAKPQTTNRSKRRALWKRRRSLDAVNVTNQWFGPRRRSQ